LVKKHGCLEEIVKHLDPAKNPLPPGFEHPAVRRARKAAEAAADAKAGKVAFNGLAAGAKAAKGSATGASSSAEAPAAAVASSSAAAEAPAASPAKVPAEAPAAAPVVSSDQLVDSDDESLVAKPQAEGPPPAAAAPAVVPLTAAEAAALEEATAAAEVAAAKLAEAAEVDDDEVDEAAEAAWEPLWVEVRQLFLSPDATPASDLDDVLKWTEPDEPGLLKFLVERMQFNEERVLGGLKRLKAARGSSSQQRMDSFFKVSGTSSSTNKRKVEEPKATKSKKGKIFTKAAPAKGKGKK
jgi:flap endonuclease-1